MNYELLAAMEGRPLNFGAMMRASAHARITGPCGDTVQIWLKIKGTRIRGASFVSDGCEDSLICCGTAAWLVKGLELCEAEALSQDTVLEAAPTIAADHRHCALLAVNTIKQAIANYYSEQTEPLRKSVLKKWIHQILNTEYGGK